MEQVRTLTGLVMITVSLFFGNAFTGLQSRENSKADEMIVLLEKIDANTQESQGSPVSGEDSGLIAFEGFEQSLDQSVNELPVTDPPVEDNATEASESVASRYPVYEVRIIGTDTAGRRVESGGCAVAVGGDRLLSAAHLSEGLRNMRCKVSVNGEWLPCSFSPLNPSGTPDFATITCNGLDLPSVQLRSPEYGESATVVGHVTGEHQGTVTNLNESMQTVSFPVEDIGTTQGDSGGGVFGADGALIGIVRSKNTNDPHNCYFESATLAEQPFASGVGDADSFPVTQEGGYYYWYESSGKRMRAPSRYGRFTYRSKVWTYRNGRMYAGTPQNKPASNGGRWVKKCYGDHCEMVWEAN